MTAADLTERLVEARLSLSVAAARAIRDNLPIDGFGDLRRLQDYADIWGVVARNAVLDALLPLVAEHEAVVVHRFLDAVEADMDSHGTCGHEWTRLDALRARADQIGGTR